MELQIEKYVMPSNDKRHFLLKKRHGYVESQKNCFEDSSDYLTFFDEIHVCIL